MDSSERLRRALDLKGRSAVVTGAGSGLGRSSAQLLAAAGATVICADLDGASAEATAAGIRDEGGAAIGVEADASSAAAHDELVAAAVSTGDELRAWVNSAGASREANVLDIVEEDLDLLLSVNLKGTLFGCQAAGRHMVEHGGGSIVNMASAAALVPSASVGAYAMTKGGVIQLTRIMAVELGRKGVRVNAVAPGYVPTKMASRFFTREDGSEDLEMKEAVLGAIAKGAPLRRVGEPDDMGLCVLYLCSDAADYVTGQVLSPNGGVAMH